MKFLLSKPNSYFSALSSADFKNVMKKYSGKISVQIVKQFFTIQPTINHYLPQRITPQSPK